MKKIQLVVNLYEKALNKGEASVNGRITEYDYGHVYKGDLQEKYYIKIKNNILIFRHWGTETLVFDLEKYDIIKYYGEGKSDVDSLNTILDCLAYREKSFHFYPSKESFLLK